MFCNFMALRSFEPKDLLLPGYMNPLNPSNITGPAARPQVGSLALGTLDEHVNLLVTGGHRVQRGGDWAAPWWCDV